MSYLVTKYPQGTFSWADVVSKDITKTHEFYKSVFGWEAMHSKEFGYTTFLMNDNATAGASTMGGSQAPVVWSSYIAVDNADEITKKAVSLGATVILEPMQVATFGKMAGILDNVGAAVFFWEAGEHIGAGVVNKPGAMSWNELYTPDVEKSKMFYSDLFGWEYKTDDDSGYLWIMNKGRMNGGMMKIQKEWGKMPPFWTVYFTVEDLEKSIEKVKNSGGKKLMGPKVVTDGVRVAMVADPSDASFMLIEMSMKPEETPGSWRG